MPHKISACIFSLILAFGISSIAKSDIVIYSLSSNGGLTGFNLAAGNPPITIDFDGIASNTNIDAATILGVTFNSPAGGAPLLVVDGNSTFTPADEFTNEIDVSTNRLFPTSGANVLSPGGLELGGGPDDPIENDDLELVFQQPLSAFGFDFLSQSADGNSFTNIKVFNQIGTMISSSPMPITNNAGGGAGAADFWGAVASNGDLIGRILIEEADGNADFPDSNIGFDTFRFTPVPEPSSFAVFGVASLLTIARRRRGRPDSAADASRLTGTWAVRHRARRG